MELKDGPMLAIDHMIAYSMFNDPAFFTQVPVFFFLKEQAEACVAKVVESIVDGPKRGASCDGCGNVREMMMPAMQSFVGQVRKLAESGPAGLEALQPLVGYVSRRRGFRPNPLSVYYREDGKVKSVDL